MLDINHQEVLDVILEESLKKFSKITPEDTKLYGKNYGKEQLLAFARYIDRAYVSPKHIQLIAEKLEAVERGEIKRLIINMPPRFGKSYTTTQLFTSWLMGRNPRREIIVSSYNDDKAKEYTGWVRDTLESDLYHSIFPDTKIRSDKRAAGEWHTTAGGKCVAAGVRGGITGYGAHFTIIDDPVKDYQEAISEVIQNRIWDWYRAVLRTRLYPGAGIIIPMTRWVTGDLAGRLIKREGLISEGGKWDVLVLPMLDTAGNPLWPEAYDMDEIQDIRQSVGEKIFQALYQQTPVDLIDKIFDEPIFRDAPDNLPIIGYFDPAFGGNDYCALTAGGLFDTDNPKESDACITGGWVWRSQINKTYDTVERIYKQEKLRKLWIESNQAQRVLKYELEQRGLNIGLVNNVANKHFRIMNYARQHWHRIVFARNSKSITPEYMKHLLSYTELSKKKDAADSLAGLIQQLGLGRASLNERYGGLANFFRRLT